MILNQKSKKINHLSQTYETHANSQTEPSIFGVKLQATHAYSYEEISTEHGDGGTLPPPSSQIQTVKSFPTPPTFLNSFYCELPTITESSFPHRRQIQLPHCRPPPFYPVRPSSPVCRPFYVAPVASPTLSRPPTATFLSLHPFRSTTTNGSRP